MCYCVCCMLLMSAVVGLLFALETEWDMKEREDAALHLGGPPYILNAGIQ